MEREKSFFRIHVKASHQKKEYFVSGKFDLLLQFIILIRRTRCYVVVLKNQRIPKLLKLHFLKSLLFVFYGFRGVLEVPPQHLCDLWPCSHGWQDPDPQGQRGQPEARPCLLTRQVQQAGMAIHRSG